MPIPTSIHGGALLALALGACAGPRIDRFDVRPQILCPEQTSVLTWEVEGQPALTLQLEPASAMEKACARTGLEVYRVTLLAAKKNEQTSRAVEVATVTPGSAEPVVLRTRQVIGSEVLADGEKDPALWADALEVAAVAACGGRELRVRHGGQEATLPADGTSSLALAGTPLGGAWELRSALSAEEQANPAKRPSQLSVLASIRCKGGSR